MYEEREYYEAKTAQAYDEAEQAQDLAYAEHLMHLEEMPATSVVALFETNKDQRGSFVMSVLDALDKGRIDPLKLHKQVKSMEQIVKMFTNKDDFPVTAKEYSKRILEAAEKQDKTGKQFEMFDAKWQIKEVGVKYDYSQCNDPLHVELSQQIERLTASLKEREKFLQTLPTKGMIITDDESGETTTLYPPSKSSTTSVSVTLK